MLKELELIFKFMRPAFSRQATYCWFVICCFGFIIRTDTLGVSSIIRSLLLDPVHYTSLLHFFHSTAWSADKFMQQWLKYISHHEAIHIVNGRVALVGDNTKQPKGARQMPAIVTMHQDSETGSKPSFFRGHHWGCLGVIIKVGAKFRALPLYANIQDGVGAFIKSRKCSKTVQIVQMATQFSKVTDQSCYLILGLVSRICG